MTISSMTGFARADGQVDTYSWTWETKSVNHRGLDIRCRLPSGFDHLEPVIRKAIDARASRGSFQISLQLKHLAGKTAWRVNEAMVDRILALAEQLQGRGGFGEPHLDGILALPGVLEQSEPDEATAKAREAAILHDLNTALDGLVAARRSEGARLSDMVGTHVAAIESLSADAVACASTQPATLRDRLKTQLADLLENHQAVTEDRLAQEISILANKADVREELDRLSAHCAAARDLLATAEPIGRRLDFLCQEFSREANTLCAKAIDPALTEIGLALKSSIDQLREQVQNIE